MSLAPHATLPLPVSPSLARYRKLAKELLKASADPLLLRAWAEHWVASLVRLSRIEITPQLPVSQREWTANLASFAAQSLSGSRRTLSHAQFILARAHGFPNWAAFAAHLLALEEAASPQARFESAANAVIRGDNETLRQLLREDPSLAHARSMREHQATLLHYTAANGVEGYRQKTPPNIVAIATLLLASGSDVDAEADLYGGHATTLMLAATSGHPERAGVQQALLALLLEHGAKIDAEDGASTIAACLANGRIQAAHFLAQRGARIGLAEAAALGHLEAVQASFSGSPAGPPSQPEIDQAFLLACQYGQMETAAYLHAQGAALTAADRHGQTPLHLAAMSAATPVVAWLIRQGAPLETENSYGGTPLGQSLWSAAHSSRPAPYLDLLASLAAAGAALPASCQPICPEIDAWLRQLGCILES